MKNVIKAVAGGVLLAVLAPAQVPGLPPQRDGVSYPVAVPMEPIAAIVEAFRSYHLVALGNVEGGNEQSHAFQLALLRDPRFTAAVNDIVVEFGNARYQDTIDRFVRGEEISYDSLKQVWQNTTQVEYEWDLPAYEEVFRSVRLVNASLGREQQVRILLGDPPLTGIRCTRRKTCSERWGIVTRMPSR